jgi:hypothetical protein
MPIAIVRAIYFALCNLGCAQNLQTISRFPEDKANQVNPDTHWVPTFPSQQTFVSYK